MVYKNGILTVNIMKKFILAEVRIMSKIYIIEIVEVEKLHLQRAYEKN